LSSSEPYPIHDPGKNASPHSRQRGLQLCRLGCLRAALFPAVLFAEFSFAFLGDSMASKAGSVVVRAMQRFEIPIFRSANDN
jgi:hypothetical protein